jgi:hypothetical protein
MSVLEERKGNSIFECGVDGKKGRRRRATEMKDFIFELCRVSDVGEGEVN